MVHNLIRAWISRVPKLQAHSNLSQLQWHEVLSYPFLNSVKRKELVRLSAALLAEYKCRKAVRAPPLEQSRLVALACCNRPRASSALVSSGTGQYDETFTLSPSRSCMISFGAASCSLMTSPYRCYCLVSFVPFCIGVTCSPARSVLDLSIDTYLHHRSQLPCSDRVAV